MAKLCLVYGDYKPIQQFINALGNEDYFCIYDELPSYGKLDMTREKMIIVSEATNPADIPDFIICFNDNYRSPMFADVEWIVQGPEERLKQYERFNPVCIVRDGYVHIGNEVRQLNQKQYLEPVTLYVRPKAKSTHTIVQTIMPKMDTIKKRFEFNMCAVTDTNGQNVPSSVMSTPALMLSSQILYGSDAIIKHLLTE